MIYEKDFAKTDDLAPWPTAILRCKSCGHESEASDFAIGYEDEIIDTCPACGTVEYTEKVEAL